MTTYDRADWHYGGEFPDTLPPENGGTHIGMLLAWAILNGLESELYRTEAPDALRAVRARQMTGRDFLFRYCHEKFTDNNLSEEGNAFAAWYCGPLTSRYLEDYERVFKSDGPTIYHVSDSWQNYDRIAPVVTERFQAWKRRQARPWWRFWGE